MGENGGKEEGREKGREWKEEEGDLLQGNRRPW